MENYAFLTACYFWNPVHQTKVGYNRTILISLYQY